ncbi:tetratricopeptide repeat protein [Plastorhodobacter daqingensis]|uniref:Tetratricopeptide repeat protein n=1 Tax=Plastorhodobacter daqingensis TaxID=1387281 RepID=A0ABW2UHR4_9RHOB
MTSRPRLAAWALAAIVAGTAPGWAQDQSLPGAYLAGRQALMANDFAAAAPFLATAVARDPDSALLRESLLLAQVALGRVGAALPVARQMMAAGQPSAVAQIVILADQLDRGAWAEIAADQPGRDTGALVDGLVAAWTQVGLGRMSEALSEFDALAQAQGLGAIARYHKALALASVGDFGGAEALLAEQAASGLGMTRRGVRAHVEVLSQLDRHEDALELIDGVLATGGDPVLAALRDRVLAGEPLPFSLVQDPADGVAEVFFTVAMALAPEAGDTIALVYSRIAEHVRPDHVDARLLTAALLEDLRQYDLATAAYNEIPRSDPAFHAAELGRADALYHGGRIDAAIEALEQLARSHADLPVVHTALGDMLRREERFDAASRAYDRAIALIETPGEQHWALFYSRGIAHEREKRWPQAEADFRKALELRPGQPLVLNYLGYSYVERNENLDEALAMIEEAVAARPDDGYITDSLGWVLYRLGRYDEAVGHMERAAELMATDPIINDHLGDVYWAVGRRLEAQFQWRRALSFNPEPEDEHRIRRKLEVGLDAVLAEEGAPPLRVTLNGN